MNIKSITSAIAGKVARPMLVGQKHSPTILFAVGVVGVVGTVVLASRATLKLDSVLEKTEAKLDKARSLKESGLEEYDEQDYQKDVLTVYCQTVAEIAVLYGPAVLVGLASIASLSGSHIILNKRYAGVTAAYAAVDQGFKEYRKRVVDEFGEEKDRELRYAVTTREIVEETDEGPKVTIEQSVTKDGLSIYARLFDEFSTSWDEHPGYNQLFIQCQQNYMNDRLRQNGHLFLNDVYEALGLPHTSAGAVVGWVLNSGGDNYVDFGVFRGDQFAASQFVNGNVDSIMLDFNVDGIIWDKI